MAKKRISRKRLLKEPDEFITLTGKIIRFAKRYQTPILGAACGIMVIFLLMTGLNYYFKYLETRAFALLDRGMAQYELSIKSNGPQKAYNDVKEDFEAIIDEYPGRKGGKTAKVVYANICYNAGAYKKAGELYSNALEDFNDNFFIKNMILSSLGHVYEKTGDYKSSAGYFERIVAGPGSSMKDEALFNLGGIYFQSGDKTKSSGYFKRIKTDHVDSMYLDIVNEKISG